MQHIAKDRKLKKEPQQLGAATLMASPLSGRDWLGVEKAITGSSQGHDQDLANDHYLAAFNTVYLIHVHECWLV